MKTLTSILLLFIVCNTSFAQTDCKPYVPTEQGTKWELTNYNAKGKITGTVNYELVDKIVDGNEVTFKIKTTTFDKKGKQIFESEYEAKCIDGVFDLDMAVKMDGSQMSQYDGMDVEVDASKFEIPEMDASPGTELEDGTLNVSIGSSGAIGFKMTIEITDRKVEKRETLTTEAGEFDCIVISQNISTKMIVKVRASSKEWYSEGIGLVRSESYNKKGKLMGYSVLTKMEN
ncbi:hypothetical protein [Winogradskyella ouciana]|uniref:TapB family protein n=1 Tax=Winogradskyella ouciana TaxID=2608631 RepID=UPI003D2AA523